MKSLSTNQMATTTGSAPLFCNCPIICQSAYMNLYTNNPVLYMMASRIWNGRACSNCSLGYDCDN